MTTAKDVTLKGLYELKVNTIDSVRVLQLFAIMVKSSDTVTVEPRKKVLEVMNGIADAYLAAAKAIDGTQGLIDELIEAVKAYEPTTPVVNVVDPNAN
jgi:hypothetical protein